MISSRTAFVAVMVLLSNIKLSRSYEVSKKALEILQNLPSAEKFLPLKAFEKPEAPGMRYLKDTVDKVRERSLKINYRQCRNNLDSEEPNVVQIRCQRNVQCYGTLIEKDIVITAAHCLFDKPAEYGAEKRVSCHSGCEVILNEGERIKISHRLRHKKYVQHIKSGIEDLYSSDLAVAMLENPVKSMPMYCLKPYCEHRDDRGSCFIYKGARKRQVSVKDCSEKFQKSTHCRLSYLLCLDDENTKTILNKGDSGSPVVCEETINGETRSFLRGVLSMRSEEEKWRGFVTNADDFMLYGLDRKCDED